MRGIVSVKNNNFETLSPLNKLDDPYKNSLKYAKEKKNPEKVLPHEFQIIMNHLQSLEEKVENVQIQQAGLDKLLQRLINKIMPGPRKGWESSSSNRYKYKKTRKYHDSSSSSRGYYRKKRYKYESSSNFSKKKWLPSSSVRRKRRFDSFKTCELAKDSLQQIADKETNFINKTPNMEHDQNFKG